MYENKNFCWKLIRKIHLYTKESINKIQMDGFSKERSYHLSVHSSGSCQPNELMPIIQPFSIYQIFVYSLYITRL